MLRTAIYMRKSSDDGTKKQEHSLERQWKDLQEYLDFQNEKRPEEKRLHIADFEKDIFQEDASAKYPGRSKFNELMARIEKGKYDAILATEPSRLSRNPLDTGRLVHFLDTEKLSYIVTLKGEFTTSYLDKFTLGLLLSISKYENDLRAANTKSGINNKKAQGDTTGIAPM